MLRVGLTGGVGSGKTAAVAMLRELGAEVSQSDEVGRALMQPGTAVFAAIVAHFGEGVLTVDGLLDRAALARIAFADGRVEELNAIVHPAVIAAQAAWFDAVAAWDAEAVAVVESALIFETKHGAADGAPTWKDRFDRIVVLTAAEDVRRGRYIERVSGLDSVVAAADETGRIVADFGRRAVAQWSDARKASLADFVVTNEGSLAELRTAMTGLFDVLKRESVARAAEAK